MSTQSETDRITKRVPRRLLRNTLRNRIIAWAFVPTIIILLAVALVTFYSYERAAQDLALQRNRELARLAAVQLANSLDSFATTLETEARTPGIRGDGSSELQPAARQDGLAEAANRMAVFDGGVVLLSGSGTLIAAQPARSREIGQDWSDRDFFQKTLRSGRPVFSDIELSGPSRSSVVVVSVPVLGERGEFVGVLAGMFRLGVTSVSAFYGNIVRLRIGESGNAILLDSRARVIYHPDPSFILDSFGDQPAIQEVIAGHAGSVRTRDVSGNDVVAGYSPVPGTTWSMVTSESWSSVYGQTAGYTRFLLVLLGLGVVVPAVVVWFGVRRITQPVAELTAAARRMAGGDFCSVISPPADEELTELATQFNTMSSELRDSYSQLEQRVADRTRELAALNRIAAVVSESLDIDHIMEDALDETMALSGMEAAAAVVIRGRDGSEPRLRTVAVRGLSDAERAEFDALSLEDWAEWPLRTEPTAMPTTDLPDGAFRRFLTRGGFQLVAAVPVVAKGRPLGQIGLASRNLRAPAADELSMFASVGRQVGLAVDNARLYAQARESAAAAERSRLARDLHDAVSQTLFSAALIADVLPRMWDKNPDEGHRRLNELRQLTRGALAEMRTLLLELRPAALESGDLPELLRQLCEAVVGRARIPVSLTVEGACDFPPDVRVALYRIAQEALNNVGKHSGAGEAAVQLRCTAASASLEITDNGRGFIPGESSPDHLGMSIMKERAEGVGATLAISSALGNGTRVSVEWRSPAEIETQTSTETGE